MRGYKTSRFEDTITSVLIWGQILPMHKQSVFLAPPILQPRKASGFYAESCYVGVTVIKKF